jgi:hypothetical protein
MIQTFAEIGEIAGSDVHIGRLGDDAFERTQIAVRVAEN